MTTPTAVSTAILTEHFRWTPLSFIDDVINSANEVLYQSVAAVEEFCTSCQPAVLGFRPPPGVIPDTDGDGNVLLTPEQLDEINKGVHALETLLEHAVDRNFDGFELFVLRNIFVVKPELVNWVRLAHHQGLDWQAVKEGENGNAVKKEEGEEEGEKVQPAEEAVARLRTLRQTLLASHALQQTLCSEKEANDRTISQLRTLVSASTSAASATSRSNNANPFTLLTNAKNTHEAAAFSVSQLELIRKLVADVRPKWQELKALRAAAVETGEEEAGETAEDKRKKYIETMTRRHVEAARGLRLNARGEVVGDMEVVGTEKRTAEEVQALERVAEDVQAGAWDGKGDQKRDAEGDTGMS